MSERRGAWYLVTGLLLGLSLGLVYALLVDPVQFVNTAPHSLGERYKDDYRVLISLAYAADGDLGRATARLALLKDENIPGMLSALAQRHLAEGKDVEAAALAALAEVLQQQALPNPEVSPSPQEPGSLLVMSVTPPLVTQTSDVQHAILTPTPAPSQSPTPFPTLTPHITLLPPEVINAAFALQEQRETCNPETSEILMQIEVLDRSKQPLPGIPITVSWEGGENTFFTGLYPQVSPGYADFSMQPDIPYTLRVGERGQVLTGFGTARCVLPDGTTYPGGWQLTFAEP